MVAVFVDSCQAGQVPRGARTVGDLIAGLELGQRSRVWVSAVVNGWQRIEPGDEKALSLPLELVERIEISTIEIEEAVTRTMETAAELARRAATRSREAGAALERGDDGSGHDAVRALCHACEDLGALARTLADLRPGAAGAIAFVKAWTGPCAQALGAVLRAYEARDHILLADHLLHDLPPALEALGNAASGEMP
jgi:hypothetical protein